MSHHNFTYLSASDHLVWSTLSFYSIRRQSYLAIGCWGDTVVEMNKRNKLPPFHISQKYLEILLLPSFLPLPTRNIKSRIIFT